MALPVLECIDFVDELSGLDEAAQGVVVEGAKAYGNSAKMLEAPVERFDRPVRDPNIEKCQNISKAFVQAARLLRMQ